MVRRDELERAWARARLLLETPGAVARDGVPDRRWFAMGDPQARLERVLEILDSHALLDGRGGLHPSVGLISMGDHFDYPEADGRARAGDEGLHVLAWLASHPPDQVVLLAGNHDLTRVQELALETDASFQAAGVAAADATISDEAFASRWPRLPSRDFVRKDAQAFLVRQRALVQRLLLDGRMTLACAGRAPGPVLFTHAGVTSREVELLGLPEAARAPAAIAAALEAWLRERVERVRPAWSRSEARALDLAPLHVAGGDGVEGHGLCYHRAADPARPGIGAKVAAFEPARPRRFHPRLLPTGLTQVVGHVGHQRCLEELPAWSDEAARARPRGGLRTLTCDGDGIRYRQGVHAPAPGAAALIMIDPEMCQAAAAPWPLLPVTTIDPGGSA